MNILVTGGREFIGSHATEVYARQGHLVRVVDDPSRARLLGRPEFNAQYTWEYLKNLQNMTLVRESVLDRAVVRTLVRDTDAVVHAAAHTAVTASLADPGVDFETNVVGTFNILEAIRATGRRIPLVFTSTNKGLRR